MAYKALDIAKTLIYMAQQDEANGGEFFTNLKLQKLLYYQQDYHGSSLLFTKKFVEQKFMLIFAE